MEQPDYIDPGIAQVSHFGKSLFIFTQPGPIPDLSKEPLINLEIPVIASAAWQSRATHQSVRDCFVTSFLAMTN